MRPGLLRLPAWLRPAHFPLSRRRRGERVIASGRVVLAAFSWLAVGLYPEAAGARPDLVALALGIYLGYAAVYAVAVWYVWRLPAWLQPATHVFDLLCFSLLCVLTGDAATPLFVFFLFSLVSATIRWRWQGTLWTALAALLAYAAIGLWVAGLPGAPPLEPDLFLIRLIYLVVAAVLLGYLGRHQEHVELDLARLAGWPRLVPGELEQLLTSAFEQVGSILAADRAALVWQEPEEPLVHLSIWESGALDWRRHPPGELEPWTVSTLADREFLSLGRGSDAISVYEENGELGYHRGRALGGALLERLSFGNALCLPLVSKSVKGLLVVCDRSHPGPDDLTTGRLVARIFASQLDQHMLIRSLERQATDAERLRLGRDLHDGVAQSMAASAMQLESLSRLIATAPAEAGSRLTEVLRQLERDQRELRQLVQQAGSANSDPRTLSLRLRELADRVERSWGVSVALELGAEIDRPLPSDLGEQLYRLAQEALINAAKHSGGSRLELKIERARSDEIVLEVSDNGHGFSFVGTRDLAALEERAEGPASIRQRVGALGGTMVLHSRRSGARMEIHLRTSVGG